MTCDKYKSVLLDAAATKEKVGEGLARHLDRCPQCRATFKAEQALFSRIDSALHARMKETPQAGFLAQVRVRLSKEASADADSSAMWSATGAALALILISMIYPLINTQQLRIQTNLATTGKGASPSIETAQIARAVREDFGVQSRPHVSKRSESKSIAPQGPEVLVPSDEQKAFAQFVSRVAGLDAMAEAVVTPAANKTAARNTDLPQVPTVDIADLQLDRTQPDPWADGSE